MPSTRMYGSVPTYIRPVTIVAGTPASAAARTASMTAGRIDPSVLSSVPSKSSASSNGRSAGAGLVTLAGAHFRGTRVRRQALEARQRRKDGRVVTHPRGTVLDQRHRAVKISGA